LKLKCDEPLSNDAFNFSLRRYSKAVLKKLRERSGASESLELFAAIVFHFVTRAQYQMLLQLALCVEQELGFNPLSLSVAKAAVAALSALPKPPDFTRVSVSDTCVGIFCKVGRCMPTVSKSVLNAPMVSALETKM
jgi:hypothetical protein